MCFQDRVSKLFHYLSCAQNIVYYLCCLLVLLPLLFDTLCALLALCTYWCPLGPPIGTQLHSDALQRISIAFFVC